LLSGLFWKTEYRFSDLDTRTNPVRVVSNGLTTGYENDSHKFVHAVRSELVYRFNWSGIYWDIGLQLDLGVKDGTFPSLRRYRGRIIWDRVEFDQAFDLVPGNALRTHGIRGWRYQT
jgi:hypothetical protein